MSPLLPYRSSSAYRLQYSRHQNPHAALDEIYEEMVDPVVNILMKTGNGGGRFYSGIGRLHEEGLISTAQWAIIIEGVLKGQTINGGFVFYIGNYPELAVDTQPFLEQFAPSKMAARYRDITEELVVQFANMQAGPDAYSDEDVEDVVSKSLVGVSDSALWEFEDLYFGSPVGIDLYADDIGNPPLNKCWCNVVACNVLNYSIANPGQLKSN